MTQTQPEARHGRTARLTQTQPVTTTNVHSEDIMGKGSTTHSDKPTFRTGNIVTPNVARVTARRGITVKIGNGDAPDYGLARPQSMTTGTAILGATQKVRRESLATDLARVSSADGPAVIRVALTFSERTPADVARNVFRETNGTGATRQIRTLAMGDDVLPTVPVLVAPVTVKARKARREASPLKANRQAEDVLLTAYLRSMGYKGTLNADIRALALDAMAFHQQVGA